MATIGSLLPFGELPIYRQGEPPLHTASPLATYLRVSPKSKEYAHLLSSIGLLNFPLAKVPSMQRGSLLPLFSKGLPEFPEVCGMALHRLITSEFSTNAQLNFVLLCLSCQYRRDLHPQTCDLRDSVTSFADNYPLARSKLSLILEPSPKDRRHLTHMLESLPKGIYVKRGDLDFAALPKSREFPGILFFAELTGPPRPFLTNARGGNFPGDKHGLLPF